MGIDRIGNGGVSGQTPASTISPAALDRAPSVAGAARAFDPSSSTSSPATSQVEASARSALQQLQSGHISVDAYLDAKVDEATAHFALPPAELESIRASLRDRLASDPTLVELVRCATGAVAPPSNPR